MKVKFPYWTCWTAYMLHNRLTEENLQRVFVWTDGIKYQFTVGDDARLPPDRWECLGRLKWVVDAEGKYFENHIVNQFPERSA
jgi:hypothetical protein